MFGEIVRRLREDRGWPPEELARLANLDSALLERIELGREAPDETVRDSLARALRVDVAMLLARWDDYPDREPFAAQVRALLRYVPSVIGTDAFRLDRILDELSAAVLEELQFGDPLDRPQLQTLAHALPTRRYPLRSAQTRAHAFAECILGMLDAYRWVLPDQSTIWAADRAAELVDAAFDCDTWDEFRATFSRVARLFASWYIANHGDYLKCFQSFLLERTRLDFALLDGRTLREDFADRYDLVSGLGSSLGSLLAGVALAGHPPAAPAAAVGPRVPAGVA